MIRIASLWVNEDRTVTDGIIHMRPVQGQSWDTELQIGDVTVARLWKADKNDKNGNPYYSGSWGKERDVRCIVFRNNSDNPKAPAYRVMIDKKDENSAATTPAAQAAPATDSDDDLPFN